MEGKMNIYEAKPKKHNPILIALIVLALISAPIIFYYRSQSTDYTVFWYPKDTTVYIKQTGLEGIVIEAKHKDYIMVRYADLTGQLHDKVFKENELSKNKIRK
jgi:hypothetical protein